MKIDIFLWQLYRFIEEDDNDSASDLIFEIFDEFMCAKKFKECDELLSSVDLERLNSFAIRSLMCITYHAKEFMTSRSVIFDKCMKRMILLRGKDIAKQLLDNLK